MIIPAAGKLFFVIDSNALELRRLVAVCEDQFGESKLAEVLRNKRDPHEHTAAMIANVDVADFADMKKTNPKKYKSLRQRRSSRVGSGKRARKFGKNYVSSLLDV